MALFENFSDSLRFVATATRHPLKMGAVWPSSHELVTAIAAHVNPTKPGPVIELGSGTGAITEALLKRSIEQGRLILIESHPSFYEDLRERFPKAQCYCANAYNIESLAGKEAIPKAAAIISGLPLRTQSAETKRLFVTSVLRLLRPGAPFIQFSYGFSPPVDAREVGGSLIATETVWKNIPPARIWVYQASPHSG